MRKYAISAITHPFISIADSQTGTNTYYQDKVLSKVNSKVKLSQSKSVNLTDLQKSPAKYLVCKTDLLRIRIFYDAYARYIDDGATLFFNQRLKNMKLIDTKYVEEDFESQDKFTLHGYFQKQTFIAKELDIANDAELMSAIRKFKYNLRSLDLEFSEFQVHNSDVRMVPGISKHMTCSGVQLLDLEQLIRSVCY